MTDGDLKETGTLVQKQLFPWFKHAGIVSNTVLKEEGKR
jgi:hypothetical protein